MVAVVSQKQVVSSDTEWQGPVKATEVANFDEANTPPFTKLSFVDKMGLIRAGVTQRQSICCSKGVGAVTLVWQAAGGRAKTWRTQSE